MASTSERGEMQVGKTLSPCGALRENANYFTAAEGEGSLKLDPQTSEWP